MPSLNSPNAYKEVKAQIVSAYIKRVIQSYSNIVQAIPTTVPTDTIELINVHKNIKDIYEKLSKVIFPDKPTKEIINKELDNWFNNNMLEYNTILESLEKQKKGIIHNTEMNHKDLILSKEIEYSNKIQEYKNKLFAIYDSIEMVHKNQQAIEDFARNCSISLASYKIDYSEMSLYEIKEMAILAKTAIEQVLSGTKGVSILTLFLYIPLFFNPFKEDLQSSVIYKYFYLVVLIVVITATHPYIIGTISLLIIIQAVGNLIKSRQNTELLCVIYQLSGNFDEFNEHIEKIIENEISVQDIKNELEHLESIDINELIKENVKSIDIKISENKSNSNESELINEINKVKTDKMYNAILYECNDKYNIEHTKYFEIKLKLERYLRSLDEAINKKALETKPPGIPVSISRAIQFDIKTTVLKYQNQILDYGTIKIPFKNILFKYKEIAERSVRIETMKLFLSSLLGNVREGFLNIRIIDTEGLGRAFSEFIKKDLSKYIKVIYTEWDKEFNYIVDLANSQLKEIGTKSFNQYNVDNDKQNKLTLEYNLIIIISTGTNLWENKTFKEFKKYSTDMGVWIWLLHGDTNLYRRDKKLPEGLVSLLDFPILIEDNEYFRGGKEQTSIYPTNKYSSVLNYTTKIGEMSVDNLIKTFNEGRIDIIDYEKEYRLIHIPDNKIWTYSTLNSIELHFGFLDGDRSNPMAETFTSDGIRPVHCLMGGVTGAGKSATINEVLANLLYMYSPEELELIMIDFKNVEFSMYTGEYLIPHAKLIAGTTDGEYALSIFNYLLDVMNDRQAKFSKYKFQNIMDWNKAVLSKKINEEYMPRVLLLCDEFQVMFTEVEDKIVDVIKTRITSLSKLARFAGLHMWFTSQSMANTMSR